MTTQVQIRGTTEASQEARTLVSRELDINTTYWRLCVHNGSVAGGIRHINSFDQQNSHFNYATASGTNALTASMRVAPSGYIAGAIYIIKVGSNNTGSATLNLNSLGAKTLKKYSSGVLSNLQSGDLISGMMIQVLYDGTYFQVVSGIGAGGTERISWIPNVTATSASINSESYTASDCIYVDLGYAVIVSFGITVQLTGTGTFKIDNLPFNSETSTAVTIKKGSGNEVVYLSASNNELTGFSGSAVSANYNSIISYIKD